MNPRQKLEMLQRYYRRNAIGSVHPEALDDNINRPLPEDLAKLAKVQGWGANLTFGQAIKAFYSDPEMDWVNDYHRTIVPPEHWEAKYSNGIAAGLIQWSGLNGVNIPVRDESSQEITGWVIAISVVLYPLLFSFAKTVVSGVSINRVDNALDIKAVHIRNKDVARHLVDLSLNFQELGVPFNEVHASSLDEAQYGLARSLAIMGARFVYLHELSHALKAHHAQDYLTDIDHFGQFQKTVYSHKQEYEADQSAFMLLLLGHRGRTADLEMAFAGASLFFQGLMTLRVVKDQFDTHPHPAERLDRIRFWIERSFRTGIFTQMVSYPIPELQALTGLEQFLTRRLMDYRIIMEAGQDLLITPLNDVFAVCAESGQTPPIADQIDRFRQKVRTWLAFGSPEKIAIHLGEAQAQAKLWLDENEEKTNLDPSEKRFNQNIIYLVHDAASELFTDEVKELHESICSRSYNFLKQEENSNARS